MGIDMFIQAMTWTDKSTPFGAIKMLEPILLWRNYDIIPWFEAHLDDDVGWNTFHEFGTDTMDAFIKDCEEATQGKGWFFEQGDPDNPEELKQDCAAIAEQLTQFKSARKTDWESDKVYFLYSQG